MQNVPYEIYYNIDRRIMRKRLYYPMGDGGFS